MFTTAVSFAGTFLFVVFVGAVAVEFSRGTFRTMLLHQPRRLRLLAGKMAGLLLFAAVVLAAAEALTWVAARLLAPSQDVATGDWISAAALGDALADYGSVLFWVTGYALLGMTLAVLVRSVPVALAIGIAWAGPFEHLLQDAWGPADRLFPGLLLEAFGIPARKGLGVEPIELLVVMERVVVEEEEALRLCEPSEGEHVAEAGVAPADVARVLVVGVLAVVDEERGAVCQIEAGERLPFANAARWAEGEFLVGDVAERRGSLADPVAEGGTGVGDGGCLDACGPDLPVALGQTRKEILAGSSCR